jgi:tetratricopeptide (TPR) repeat protein
MVRTRTLHGGCRAASSPPIATSSCGTSRVTRSTSGVQPFYPWTAYNHSTSSFLDRKALSQASPSSLPRLLSEVYPVGDLVLPITPVSFSADGDRLLMGGMDGVSGMGRGGNPNWVWTAFANGVVRGNSLPLLAEPTLPYWNQAIWAELADHRRAYRAIDLANDPLHLGGLRLATAPNPTATAADASQLRSAVQDLLAFAPGMETTQADVLAVVEREAQRVNSAVRGKIDRAAKRLIERARSGGWSQVEVPRAADAALQVRFDLSGRHQIVGRTPYGLHEEILCDGQRLWHLYSDLGIGSRREYSRFHRQALSRWIPWLLPPAEELADGADVVSLDPHTVAVVPHRSETSSDRPADTADFPQMLLVFDDDGRLTERHWVTGSDRAVVIRETYGVDGTVQRRDGEGRLLRSIRIPVTPCKAPDLAPDDSLVVLPLPWRTREHVIGAADLKDDGVFDGWSRSDALAVLGAETAAGLPSMRSTISWCFLDERDPRLGFYVLMLAAGVEWPREQDPEPGESRAAAGLFTALEQGPGTPLAGYLDAVDRLRRDDETSRIDWSDKDKRSFASALAGLHDLCADWRDASGKPLLADSKLERRTIRYLLRRPPLPFAAKLLATVRQTGDAESFLRILDGTQQAFPGREPTAYLLRLVHARAVAANETGSRGQKLFVALTGEMLESGCVPLLDSDIRETFFSGPGGSAAWNALVTQISERVLQAPSNPTALEVARRLHELSGEENAERIFSAFAAGNSAENQLAWTLLAVAYLDATSQHARAGAMLASLLADDRWRGHAGLWRLAAAVAKNGGAAVPAAMHLDRALELEYVQRAGEIDLKRFRQEYRQLLEYWAQAGDSLAGAGDAARQSLEGSVVRAADRWREIDPAVAEPCSLAADALARVGAVDLAWDYLTTLLADGSSESPDWHDRGRVYHRQGAFDLAVRAYGLAAEDHPENAEILWYKAQALGEGGYPDAARAILRDIAEGSWAPEYAWISDQARRAIESPADSEASP